MSAYVETLSISRHTLNLQGVSEKNYMNIYDILFFFLKIFFCIAIIIFKNKS